MKLDRAVEAVGHSCGRRQFLSLARELDIILDDDLREDWTEAHVAAIRACRTFPPSLAARQVLGVDGAVAFAAAATALELAPPWTTEKIEAVQVSVTKDFPGHTTAQAAVLIGCDDSWLRRRAKVLGLGTKLKGGCYMVDGKRRQLPRAPWSFSDEDIATIKSLMDPEYVKIKLEVPKPLYDAAVIKAQESELVSPRSILEKRFNE